MRRIFRVRSVFAGKYLGISIVYSKLLIVLICQDSKNNIKHQQFAAFKSYLYYIRARDMACQKFTLQRMFARG